jgi:hypothetical protein
LNCAPAVVHFVEGCATLRNKLVVVEGFGEERWSTSMGARAGQVYTAAWLASTVIGEEISLP